MALEVGSQIEGNYSKYTILEEIARGGMGAVLKAKEESSDAVVVIKDACLDPAVCQENLIEIRKQLLLEMSVLKSLDHRNVPKIYDQFTQDHHEYLVMDYIQGKTVLQILRDASYEDRLLDEGRVLGWAIQTLDTLIYLHEREKPVIHRDIKPENLMLTPDGNLMLIDFGLMKRVERELAISGPLIKAVGTVEYAPIEQYADSGATTDARSDIYSLGATLYHCLAGELPPRAIDRVMPMSVDVTKMPPSLCEINPTVSKRTEQIIFKAMEYAPENRYQTARAMREAFVPPRKFFLLPFG